MLLYKQLFSSSSTGVRYGTASNFKPRYNMPFMKENVDEIYSVKLPQQESEKDVEGA